MRKRIEINCVLYYSGLDFVLLVKLSLWQFHYLYNDNLIVLCAYNDLKKTTYIIFFSETC